MQRWFQNRRAKVKRQESTTTLRVSDVNFCLFKGLLLALGDVKTFGLVFGKVILKFTGCYMRMDYELPNDIFRFPVA